MADTVYCLKDKDGKPSLLWKTSVRKDLTTARTQTRQSSRGVAVSDVSGDGELDVIFCTCSDYERKAYALNGKNGSKLWEFEVTGPKGDTKKYYPPTVPVIEDLDGDGKVEVFFVAGAPVDKFYGRAYCLKTKGKGPAWTMSRRDLRHTGCVPVTKSKHSKKGKNKK
jgi:outer membrane protein assembly factor BamB